LTITLLPSSGTPLKIGCDGTTASSFTGVVGVSGVLSSLFLDRPKRVPRAANADMTIIGLVTTEFHTSVSASV
jgi:hypothetical protein